MVTRMFFRLLHKWTGIPTAGIQVWRGFPELCSMGAVESAFCINSVACHSYVLCKAWEGGAWQSFLPLFGHNAVSRGLSCGANVQSVCFSSRVGWGRVIFNTDRNNGLTYITPPPGSWRRKKGHVQRTAAQGWDREAESSAAWDSFAASTSCNSTLAACSSQPGIL